LPNPVKINNLPVENPKVLLAALDWGLGHATRCIPIIKELVNQKCTVIVAVSGAQKEVFDREIPDLDIVEIPGYDIKYDKNRALTILRLIFSIPKILIRVKRENAWIRRWARLERPDLIISDNRYGLYVPGVVSVFMTHQLLIRTPWGGTADRWLQRMNYSLIRRFRMCWVPDVEGQDGLAGELSHPKRMPGVPVRYVGWLSRFGGRAAAAGTPVEGVDLLILLSGPEPQRSLLERRLLDQLADYSGRVVLVRGLPAGASTAGPAAAPSGQRLSVPPGVKVYDHLPAAELEPLIRGAEQIICRPGYSTVMDLVRLGRRAIVVPTPGQTEQEYLGNYLASRGGAICADQKGFSLMDALAAARGEWGVQGLATGEGREMDIPGVRPLPDPSAGEGLLQQAIAEVLAQVRSKNSNSAGM